MTHRRGFLPLALLLIIVSTTLESYGQRSKDLMDVGVASVDITPDGPIRLTGFAARKKTESEGVMHNLYAKAMAFGTDAQNPSILITVDLLGIPGHMTKRLANALAMRVGLKPEHLAICASHTHGGPEVGTLNILQARDTTFSDSLISLDQLVHITRYMDQLNAKLLEVAMTALQNRRPSRVSWGQGQATFARNRRAQGGPVDHSLPVIKVTEPDGKLRAVLVNYACHGTTLNGSVNEIHGDWIGEAQKIMENNHPGVVAMVAIGCGADANPHPRGEIEHMKSHAQQISDNVDKLLTAELQPLTSPPVGRLKWVRLPFAHVPSIPELIKQTDDKTVKGFYARLALDRLARGQSIPSEIDYPVQTWRFGNALLMINLAGEVVVDYSVRLKGELDSSRLWINAYANDAPCYIASRRVIREGGYEAESSMYWYDKPSPFAEEVEDIIVGAVREIAPRGFK